MDAFVGVASLFVHWRFVGDYVPAVHKKMPIWGPDVLEFSPINETGFHCGGTTDQLKNLSHVLEPQSGKSSRRPLTVYIPAILVFIAHTAT